MCPYYNISVKIWQMNNMPDCRKVELHRNMCLTISFSKSFKVFRGKSAPCIALITYLFWEFVLRSSLWTREGLKTQCEVSPQYYSCLNYLSFPLTYHGVQNQFEKQRVNWIWVCKKRKEKERKNRTTPLLQSLCGSADVWRCSRCL